MKENSQDTKKLPLHTWNDAHALIIKMIQLKSTLRYYFLSVKLAKITGILRTHIEKTVDEQFMHRHTCW